MFKVVSEPDGKILNETALQKVRAQQNVSPLRRAGSSAQQFCAPKHLTAVRCEGELLLQHACDSKKVTCTKPTGAGSVAKDYIT